MSKIVLALALGGGAARGWAHIGVFRTLCAAGLKPQLVVGTSIGAIVGAHYVTGRLDELEAFARSLTRRKFAGYLDVSLTGSGLIAGQRLFDRFNEHLNGSKIEDLDTRFVAIATELGTGHEIWLRRGSLVDAVRASSAIPGIVRPVSIGGRWLVDGSLVNPIPVSVCRALGAHVVVAVNLNGDGFGKGATLTHDETETAADCATKGPLPLEWNSRAALQVLHRQFFGQRGETAPSISSVIFDSFSIVHDRMARARLMGDPPDLMISPDLSGVGAFDVHRAEELITLGQVAAQEQLAAIQRRVNAAHQQMGRSSGSAVQSPHVRSRAK